MGPSILASRLLFIYFFIFTFFNPVLAADVTTQTTPADEQVSTDTSPITLPSISEPSTTTITSKNVSTTQSPSSTKINPPTRTKEIERIVPEPPTIQLALDGESLKLNITILEKIVEFSLILDYSSINKIGGGSESKRLLLALENEHFNVDVISVPLTGGSKEQNGKISFGKKVEDWGWNKRNGILLLDNTQNYKWLSTASNGSTTISVTFQRNWQTCDVQDIHFGLSPIKIWWLLETEENKVPTKNDKMLDKSEKQRVSTTIIPPSGESNNSNYTTQQPPLEGKSSTMNINTTMASIEDVEILRSIQESNFQGPANFSFASLLKNVTAFFIKGCGGSTQFLCNGSDIQQLQSANRSEFLSIAKIQNAEFNKNAYGKAQQPCSIAMEEMNGGNEKQFQALFGFPNKNQGTLLVIPCWSTKYFLLMLMVVHVLWT